MLSQELLELREAYLNYCDNISSLRNCLLALSASASSGDAKECDEYEAS